MNAAMRVRSGRVWVSVEFCWLVLCCVPSALMLWEHEVAGSNPVPPSSDSLTLDAPWLKLLTAKLDRNRRGLLAVDREAA